LGKIRLTSKYILDTLPVEVESIGCGLEMVFFGDSITKRGQELVGCFAVAFCCFGINASLGHYPDSGLKPRTRIPRIC